MSDSDCLAVVSIEFRDSSAWSGLDLNTTCAAPAWTTILVLGSTLPLAIAFRYPMIALGVIIASFTAHAGLNHDVIWAVQFTALLSAFLAITRGRDRQALLALLLVYTGVVITFGIFTEEDRVGNVLVQILLFGGLWIIKEGTRP